MYAKYVGRDCVARLNPDVTIKLSFITRGIADHYEALSIQLINRREGQIDRQIVNFRDLWGEYSLRGITRSMYVWTDGSKTDWYGLAALVDTGDVHTLMIGAAGVGKTAFFLYPNIEFACACGMSFLQTDTKGDVARNYGSIAQKYYG